MGHDFSQSFERLRFFLDNIRYSRERHFYLVLVFIIFFVSAFSTGLYFYQKKEIKEKENILKSYFAEINAESIKAANEDNNDTWKSLQASISADLSENVEEEKIFVYICGEVQSPGVYEIDHQSRVSDLLDLSGGATDLACLEAVNLAKKLQDGERIYIPSKEEVSDAGIELSETDGLDPSENISGLINVNQATIEELIKLPGIGEQIAKNIIDHRKKFGFFKSKEELKNVSGIGDKKYAQIEELISI